MLACMITPGAGEPGGAATVSGPARPRGGLVRPNGYARQRAGEGPLDGRADDQLAQGAAAAAGAVRPPRRIMDAGATLAAGVICFRILHHDVL